MLGDNDTKGGGGGGNQICRKNILVSPGQVGIGVAGGDNILVQGNTVIGGQSDVSNVGIYAWNQSNAPGGTITVSNNRVSWTGKDGTPNNWWQGTGFASVKLENANPMFRHGAR